VRGKRPLISYCETKLEWDKEEYAVCCARNERSGLTWFKTGIWKLTVRGVRRGFEKESWAVCRKAEDAVCSLYH
jgi:hypothetical protein